VPTVDSEGYNTTGQILSAHLCMSKYNIVHINDSQDTVGRRENKIDILHAATMRWYVSKNLCTFF
jgi:hypothetical protein